MPNREFVALDPGDAKFMGLIERFSERLEWMKGDADQRNRQLEMQAATLAALEKGMAKMEGMISGMRDELRVTAHLQQRVNETEKWLIRLQDSCTVSDAKVEALADFKDRVLNRLAVIGVACFAGGSGTALLISKLIFGAH